MKKLEQIDAKNALEKFLLELRQTLVSQEIVEKVRSLHPRSGPFRDVPFRVL